jgi:hypothetical protein
MPGLKAIGAANIAWKGIILRVAVTVCVSDRVAARSVLRDYWWNKAGNSLAKQPSMMEGAMEIVFWVIVVIIVVAVVYICALSFRKHKEALGRDPAGSDAAPGTKEHGVDLQARRKTYDDVT